MRDAWPYRCGFRVAAAVVTAMLFAWSPAWGEVANPNGVAVIIGNGAYEHPDVPDVEFAHRDAEAFLRFVTEVLGYDPDNVIDLRDTTRRELWDAFGTRTDPRSRLWSYLDPDSGSDVVVFYSGHGVPGTDDGRGYLLPMDGDPNAAAEDGYPIDLLYRNVGQLAEARSVRVYLDACFSGGSHGGSLIHDASPVYLPAALPSDVTAKVASLTAASGDQLASWDRESGHGLFTHHLLDALYGGGDTDGDGRVTAREAKVYLDTHMTRAARRLERRVQHASLLGAPDIVLASAPADGFPARSLVAIDEKDAAAFAAAKAAGTPAAYADYLAAWPDGYHAAEAKRLQAAAERAERERRERVVRERDDAAFAAAKQAGTSAAYADYLAAWPDGHHAAEAKRLQTAAERAEREQREREASERDDAAFAAARQAGTSAGYRRYLRAWPEGRHAGPARRLRDEAAAAEAAAREEQVQAGLQQARQAANLGEFLAAERALDELLERFPGDDGLQQALAVLDRRIADEHARQSRLDEIRKLDEAMRAAFASGRWVDAYASLGAILKLNDGDVDDEQLAAIGSLIRGRMRGQTGGDLVPLTIEEPGDTGGDEQ